MELVLPEGVINDYSKLELSEQKISILSDIHIPYHDVKALEVAVADIKKFNPDVIIYNGDIADCYQVSSFDKDPRKHSLAKERDLTRQFFEYMLGRFPKKRHIYRLGNHEERWERIVYRTPALMDLGINTWAELMANGWDTPIEYFGEKRLIKAGDLNIAHGHELGNGGGVNVGRWLFLKAQASIIAGHFHRTGEHIETNINDNVQGSWGIGCLCDIHPMYHPNNKWNQGFAHIELYGKQFSVINKRIINGIAR